MRKFFRGKRLPWIFKYGLRLHRPQYRITVPDLGLEKEENRRIVFWVIITLLGVFFGGIFIILYEFTPPMIEVGGAATVIYPGFSRETTTEFILAMLVFLSAAAGTYLMRTAPRREEEAWRTHMFSGMVLFMLATLLISVIFAYKAGLLRFGR